MIPSQRVAIIGAGNVGASCAYSILSQQIAKEIIVMDIAVDLAKAQVLDMEDSTNFTEGVKISYGEYRDLMDGDIVVITCGAAQKEGQTRLELLQINAKIIRSVLSEIKKTNKKVYIVMVTNPVDVLTYIAIKESGLDVKYVFGSGTNLDSARLKIELSKLLEVNPKDINAYILGEHGDSSFPALSSANVRGVKLSDLKKLDDKFKKDTAESIRQKAYKIIEGKKATYYGIGSSIAEICKVIIRDEKKILPLSTLVNGEYGVKDVSLSVPVQLSSDGTKIYEGLSLNEEEQTLLNTSAKVLQDNIKNI